MQLGRDFQLVQCAPEGGGRTGLTRAAAVTAITETVDIGTLEKKREVIATQLAGGDSNLRGPSPLSMAKTKRKATACTGSVSIRIADALLTADGTTQAKLI